MTLGKQPVIRHLRQPMTKMPEKSRVTRHQPSIPPQNNYPRFRADLGLCNLPSPWCMMTHKYRGSQQSSREVKPKFIDSTQGEPKDIYKP
jgi:hypothetical protein